MATATTGDGRTPHLKVTKYDTTSSFLLATGAILGLLAIVLLIIWLTNLEPRATDDIIPIEMVGGGDEDGAPDETLNVESPADPSDDPSVAEEPSEEVELMEMLENVVELSDNATQMVVTEVQVTGTKNSGTPGSAVGTGRRPLGRGGGKGGYPREQRWIVKFADQTSLKAYARQLDFFKIELGAYFPETGTLIYLTNVSADAPTRREVNKGKDDRLFMNWQGGSDRRKADLSLFKKAGINASTAHVVHFYPRATEELLVRAERSYQNLPSSRIRLTYFQVTGDGGGYKFTVTRQVPK